MAMDFVSLPDPNALPSWVGPAVVILASILALVGIILGVVLRKPVQVTELWNENRSLHKDITEMRADYNAMDLKFTQKIKQVIQGQQIVGDGFIALSETVEEAKVKLVYTPDRRQKIEAARQYLASDIDWPTVG